MSSWTCEEENFIKLNRMHMTYKDIAARLGKEPKTVKNKIVKMVKTKKLPKKNESYENKSFEVMLETEGRNKTKNFHSLRNKFKVNEEITIKTFISSKQDPEITVGKIIQKTDSIVAIKTNNYIRTFSYDDFYIKKSLVI